MFYSHTFLARKSPLGTIWIAAHLEHKIKRPQIESINIPSYAEKIMMPDVPIALRLSGHLLIGIVRIYSWKVNHLFTDCNKLVTDIRKAFASVPVDLPIEADHAPFESVTLPETFDLNALELDESYYRTDEPDKYVKSYNQITMADQIPVEEEQYVAVSIGEENVLNLSPRLSTGLNLSSRPTNVLNSSPQPTNISPISRQLEDDTLPPFEGGFESILSPQEHTFFNGNAPAEMKVLDENNILQGTLDSENMLCDPDHPLQEVSVPGDIQIGQESSPTINRRQSLSTIPEDISILEGGSFHRVEHLVNTSSNKLNFPDLEASAVVRSPVLNPEPAPPVKRRNVKKRKKIQTFDRQLVLSNMQMKKQLGESSSIVCKRRKLPCSDLDLWKFQRFRMKEGIFGMPSLSRMDAKLVETLERSYPCSIVDNITLETPGLLPAAPEGAVPEKEIGTMMMDARPATPTIDAFSDIEKRRDGVNTEDLIAQFTLDQSGFGSESHKDKNSETILRSATEISPPVEPSRLNLETPPFHLREHHLDYTEVPEAPGLLDSADDDLNFLNANEASPGLQEAFKIENLSARTRAVAKYFKDNSQEAESDESGHISLNRILEQKNRKQCSRMFFETLVLKSYNFINVEQKDAYGDILISPTPALFSTKF